MAENTDAPRPAHVYGPLKIDPNTATVTYGEKPVGLTGDEVQTLLSVITHGASEKRQPTGKDMRKVLGRINLKFFEATNRAYVPFDRITREPPKPEMKSATKQPDLVFHFFVMPDKPNTVLADMKIIYGQPSRAIMTPRAQRIATDIANG